MTTKLMMALALMLGVAAAGCAGSSETANPTDLRASEVLNTPERTACRVLAVYDGDTLACDLNGNGRIDAPEERIRLLGIDTPETRFSKKFKRRQKKRKGRRKNTRNTVFGEPFSETAWKALQQATDDRTVYLESDRRQYDPYGRRLAFVYTRPDATVSINESLLQQGFATTLFIPPNEHYRDRFEQREAEARQARRGLWQPGSDNRP